MKATIKFISFILAAIVLLPSCQDLDPVNYSQINPANFPTTKTDAELLVTTCYNRFGGDKSLYYYEWSNMANLQEVSTDAGYNTLQDRGYFIQIDNLTYTADNEFITQQFWDYNYVSLCTQTIPQLQALEAADTVKSYKDLIKRYVAEVKVIRAWESLGIYTLYGPFPVADLETLKNPQTDVFLERPTTEWMVNFIEKDLLEGAPDLPVSYGVSEYGRVTRGLAKFLLMKLYMHEKLWAKAEAMGRELINPSNGYGYDIIPFEEGGYQGVFSINKLRNREIIYAYPTNIDNFPNYWTGWCLTPDYPYGLNSKLKERWNEQKIEWAYYNKFEKNDERLKSAVGEYTTFPDRKGNVFTYNEANPGLYNKYGAIPLKYDFDPNAYANKTGHDVIVFRYADVLLYLAEAINNNNRSDMTLAAECINEVRRRSLLPEIPVDGSGVFATTTIKDVIYSYNLSDVSGFNDFILAERGHELFWECSRRDDLIRHGKYLDYCQSINPTPPVERFLLFPLPPAIITESRGKVVQNYGW